jgi:hypothetical protein
MQKRSCRRLLSRKLANSSGKTSCLPTEYQGSPDISISGYGASGMTPEVAVGHVLDLVVVVEHDLAVAGDAEVLPQHVAGEDVGATRSLMALPYSSTAWSICSGVAVSR